MLARSCVALLLLLAGACDGGDGSGDPERASGVGGAGGSAQGGGQAGGASSEPAAFSSPTTPNPFVLQATAPEATQFGVAVAIDGGTLVVAQRGASQDCGSAVVFERSETAWTVTQTLSTPDCIYNYPLFMEVAVEGDTVAASSSKSAYVYERAAGSWTGPEVVTVIEEGQIGGVALGGGRLAVGLPDYAQGGTLVGAVEIYEREAAHWVVRQRLLGPSDDRGFGSSLRLDVDRLIVGSATAIGVLTPGRGAAHVFALGADGRFVEELDLASLVPDHNETFGNAVDIRGDRAIVGDVEGGVRPDGGAAYMFAHGASGWRLEQTLLPLSGGSRFGESVALTEDRAVVGDPSMPYLGSSDPSDEQVGTAYLYQRSGESWSALEPLWADPPMYKDHQGQRVALSEEHVVVAGVNANTAYALGQNFGTVRVLWLAR